MPPPECRRRPRERRAPDCSAGGHASGGPGGRAVFLRRVRSVCGRDRRLGALMRYGAHGGVPAYLLPGQVPGLGAAETLSLPGGVRVEYPDIEEYLPAVPSSIAQYEGMVSA